MGAKISVLGLLMSFPPYLRYAMVRFPLQQKTTAGQTLYRTLSLHIYGWGNIYLERDMKKPGSSEPFPKGTGCTPLFFRMFAGTKLNCALNNSSPNNNKKWRKSQNLAFLKGYIYAKWIYAISTINALKWWRSAGTWKFSSNATFWSAEAPLD